MAQSPEFFNEEVLKKAPTTRLLLYGELDPKTIEEEAQRLKTLHPDWEGLQQFSVVLDSTMKAFNHELDDKDKGNLIIILLSSGSELGPNNVDFFAGEVQTRLEILNLFDMIPGRDHDAHRGHDFARGVMINGAKLLSDQSAQEVDPSRFSPILTFSVDMPGWE